jgi:hypothetical protein
MLEFLLGDSSHHLDWVAPHGDEEGGGDGADVIGFGQGFALVDVDLIDNNLVLVGPSQLFKYRSQHAAWATPSGIEVYDGREVAIVLPCRVWRTEVGYMFSKLAFGEVDYIHTVSYCFYSMITPTGRKRFF